MLTRSSRRRISAGGSSWRRPRRSAGACSPSVILSLGLALALALAARGGEVPDGPLTLGLLMERMASASGVEANFREHKEVSLLARPLETRGVLYFVPPDRLARFTFEPFRSALLVDGEALRYLDGAEREEFDLSGSPQARIFTENFVVLFGGDRAKLERIYETQLSADDGRWELRLRPRRAPLDRFLAEITLRGDARGLQAMVVRDRDGDRTTTVFDEVTQDREFRPEELERLFGAGRPLVGAAEAP